MAVTGFRLPSSATQTAGAWTSPNNLLTDDSVYASAVCNSAGDRILTGNNLGFSTTVLPNGSTITAVEVRVRWFRSSTNATHKTNMRVRVSGATVGAEKSKPTVYTTASLDTFNITADRAWAPADFRDGVLDVQCVCAFNNVTSSTHSYDHVAVQVTYTPPVPTVSSCAPTRGVPGGGTAVTITGTGLIGASSVTFGGTAATGVTVVNETTITCTAPAHAPGLVSVAVTTPGGTGSANAYTYDQSAALAATEQPDVAAFSAGVFWSISLAATEQPDVAAASASVYWDVVLAATEAPDVAAFEASVEFELALAATEAPDIADMSTSIEWLVQLVATEGPDVAEFSALIYFPFDAVIDAVEGSDVASMLGEVYWDAVLDATEAPDEALFIAIPPLEAVLNATEAPDVVSFTLYSYWLLDETYLEGLVKLPTSLTGIEIEPTIAIGKKVSLAVLSGVSHSTNIAAVQKKLFTPAAGIVRRPTEIDMVI